MKKAIKITGKILMILLILLLLFTLITFIMHRVRTNHETALLKENGYYNPVSVGDYALNVATFGNENGSHTIVAIAGLGMGDYSIAERKMTAALEKDNRIIFIDRAGYGFSDDTNHEMTTEYIVEDYRKALQNAGIKAPYILMPHSIGGAYSNYWSSKYPDEIEGIDSEPDDSAFSATAVSGMLKWPMAQLYTETYLHEEDKERITELVNEVKEAYHGILNDADFLSDETREKAIEKLDAIEPRVLYPDSWEKYEYKGLDFKGPEEGGTLWEALQAIEDYQLRKEVEEFSEPVDKKIWTATPQTFNCGYEPLTNSIYILGAYARGDIYNSEMSDEEVLAKLGVSIGHEISHAFDRTGAQFDKDGNMKNWWTKEDKEEFKKRNARLAEYYNAIHPWEGQNLKGSIMTGEACADMAGMKVALRIASEKKNFDYDKFFRAFADLWLAKENLLAVQAGIENEHPLNYLRINCTLQQYDEFLDFYGITEGDNMYLAPEERVNIW